MSLTVFSSLLSIACVSVPLTINGDDDGKLVEFHDFTKSSIKSTNLKSKYFDT